MSDIEKWMPIGEASRKFDISHHVIKRLISEGLESRPSLIDRRKVLINVQQLRQILGMQSNGL